MPKYLVRLNPEGMPVGVHSPNRHHYDPAYANMEKSGRAVVGGHAEGVSWEEFIPHVLSAVSQHNRWDTFESASRDLATVLSEARAQVEFEGYPDEE